LFITLTAGVEQPFCSELLMSEQSSTLNRPRVLLADDHPPLLAAERALLTPYFDVVGTAPDGGKLVSEALRLEPDVIVADISMPVLSGIQAAHQLRALGSSVRLVFLTVHADEEFVMACKAEGALGYVLKAKMKTQLVPAVHAALAGVYFLPSGASV
jgi:DNA-binding NarL/FixJ family response regulator